MKIRSATLGLILLFALTANASARRPVTFDDIMAMKSVSAAMISPDGKWVLYTVRQWESTRQDEKEPDKKESCTHVWRVAAETPGSARQLTYGERGESSPAWSPDGKLVSFLATRGKSEASDETPRPQIYLMNAAGGEAWKLTDAKEGVQSYAWSPDGKQISFTAREALTKEDEEKRKRKDDPSVFEGELRFIHLFTIDVATGKASQHTKGADFTLRGRPSWSPDGKEIVFSAAPTTMTRDDRQDIYILALESDSVEKITSNPGPDQSPAWSPDGGRIAFLSEANPGPPQGDGIALQAIGNSHLILYDVATRRAQDRSSRDFDLSPGEPNWTPDGSRILISTGARAYREMFSFEVAAGRYTELTKGKNVSFGSMSRDGSRVAFTMESPLSPSDVYVADAAFSTPQKLTSTNPVVEELHLGETEVITWKSDGLDIEGVLLKPVGWEAGKRYPLLVVVHGGPTGAHHNTFRVGFGDGGQHWAGQGWAVLYPNPRGSTNYGEKFMRGNVPDWGGGDYRDIMAGVDAVIARGVADPEKLAVMGWSYGGYMTCWIVSQTSRFKAAMMGAGLSNLYSMYGTTDIPNYLGTFFEGRPDPKAIPLYLERSGITGVDRVTTPLLILHGGQDERVPIGQPMEFYRALKDRGKTVELVFYPREGHGLSEYFHQLDRMKRQYEWIRRHTLGAAERKPTTQEARR